MAAQCLSSRSSVSASRVSDHAAVTGCTYCDWSQRSQEKMKLTTELSIRRDIYCFVFVPKAKDTWRKKKPTSCMFNSILPDWVSVSQSDQKGEIWDREFLKHWFAYTNETSYNWWELIFFFLLWLSYNWVWTSSRGELIDLRLNSGLFSLDNNYAPTGWAEENRWPPPPIVFASPLLLPLFVMRGIISAAIHNLSQTIHRVLLSEKVELDEKCPPARYMKVWNCRLLFALSRVPQKVFLLLLTERLNFWWLLLPLAHHVLLQPWLLLFPGHLLSIAATFSISQGLLYEDRRPRHQRLRWETYINLSRETIQKKHIERFSLSCSAGDTDLAEAPPWCNFIKWIIK